MSPKRSTLLPALGDPIAVPRSVRERRGFVAALAPWESRLFVASMRLFLPVIIAGTLAACSKPLDIVFDKPASDPFEVQVNVFSDPGVPLPGAELYSADRLVGRTDAAGTARVRIAGREGDQVDLSVRCPSDYESPSSPLSIALRRLSKESQVPRFEARCAPTSRTVVVGLRVENGPNFPIIYLGNAVARTDASGAALFVAKVKPAEQVEVTVSTAESGSEQLRPQNPTLTFVAKDSDDVVVLDQSFTVLKKPVHYVAPPKINRPTRLQ